MSRYGPDEFGYANPIAVGLVENIPFRVWFLSKTPFRRYAEIARLLHEEQRTTRSPTADNWWRSYWVMASSCACGECRERETDLLAIFSTPDDYRFALHVEVKSPRDRFSLDQAIDYQRRAKCWSGRANAPKTIFPHDVAATVLACEAGFANLNSYQTSLFNAVITFDEISQWLSPYPSQID